MKFLHCEMNAGPENVIRVTLDRQANVLLMNDSNFCSYRNGRSYRYSGGLAKRSPASLVPPYSGHWHVVVDPGGYPGRVRAGISTV
jgi:hypothetical protein